MCGGGAGPRAGADSSAQSPVDGGMLRYAQHEQLSYVDEKLIPKADSGMTKAQVSCESHS